MPKRNISSMKVFQKMLFSKYLTVDENDVIRNTQTGNIVGKSSSKVYPLVQIKYEGTTYNIGCHYIIWMHHNNLKLPSSDYIMSFADKNPSNYKYDNIIYTSCVDFMKKIKRRQNKINNNRSMSTEQVIRCRTNYANGTQSLNEIKNELQKEGVCISRPSVISMLHNKTYKDVPAVEKTVTLTAGDRIKPKPKVIRPKVVKVKVIKEKMPKAKKVVEKQNTNTLRSFICYHLKHIKQQSDEFICSLFNDLTPGTIEENINNYDFKLYYKNRINCIERFKDKPKLLKKLMLI